MLLDCMYVNVKYYLICVKLFKNAIKICSRKRQCVSASGGLCPPGPLLGLGPWTCWGLPSPRPPRLCSSKISFKNPLLCTDTLGLRATSQTVSCFVVPIRTYTNSLYRIFVCLGVLMQTTFVYLLKVASVDDGSRRLVFTVIILLL